MEQRTCPTCGASFTPTYRSQRFCPPTDADRERITARGTKTQVRSRCAKRYDNARQRGTLASVLDDLPPVAPFDCAQCGVRCVQGENVAPHATKFCGQKCKAAWHRPLVFDPLADPGDRGFRTVLRRDPCAYCGARPSGIDHIVPTSGGGANDATNWTGCCKRCNGAKGDLPLLAALQWLPISREYHDLRRVLWHQAA